MCLILTTSLYKSEISAAQLLMLILGSTTESSIENKYYPHCYCLIGSQNFHFIHILIRKYSKQYDSISATKQLKYVSNFVLFYRFKRRL